MIKNFLLFLLFYILALLESSFQIFFDFAGSHCYLIFVAAFLLVFLDSKENRFLPILFGGFFLDIFSGGIFGLKTLSLLLTALFVRFLLNFIRQKNILWLIFFFSITFFPYRFCGSFTVFSSGPVELIYNLAFAILGFFLIKIWNSSFPKKNRRA